MLDLLPDLCDQHGDAVQVAITANYGISAFSTEQFLTLGVGFNF